MLLEKGKKQRVHLGVKKAVFEYGGLNGLVNDLFEVWWLQFEHNY